MSMKEAIENARNALMELSGEIDALEKAYAKCDTEERIKAQLLTKREAAKYLSISMSTLDSWRLRKIGPRCIKMDGPTGRVLYPLASLQEYIAECLARQPVVIPGLRELGDKYAESLSA